MIKRNKLETEYEHRHKQTRALLTDLKKTLATLPMEDRAEWEVRLEACSGDAHTPLRVALAGEYDVGKSTIIKALTGADVKIDSDVTTSEITPYDFGDIVLLDMPGTLSGLAEHDRLAMKAIIESDLLLFVLTNELFNSESRTYFTDATDKYKKANQTLLVINQFDRVNLRNRTPEMAIAFMTEALSDIVKPLAISDLRPVFISARDYCDAITESDPKTKEELILSSRMESLTAAIHDFCRAKGLYGRSARPVQIILAVASECLQAACGDPDEKAAYNYLDRRRQILLQELSAWKDKTRNLCESVRAAVRRCADPILTAVEQRAAPEEVDSLYAEADSNVARVVDKCEHDITDLCELAFRTLGVRLAELNATPVGNRIMNREIIGSETLNPKVKAPGKHSPSSATALNAVANGMKTAGVKLAANAGKYGKDAAEKLRAFIKYKPYGKIKMGKNIAKYLGRAGKFLGPLAVGLEVYMNYRSEKNKEKEDDLRRQCKADIRGNFVSFADAVYEAASQSLSQFEQEMLVSDLDSVSQECARLQAQTQHSKELTHELIRITERAQNLLREI